MSQVKVNSISDRNNVSSPTLTYGASLPSGSTIGIQGNINITTGITTVGFLSATNINVTGIVTASSFVGDGSGLQGVVVVSSAKSIALKTILDPLPFRS